MSLTANTVEILTEKTVFRVETGTISFAERDHAWHIHTVGIVENILETKCVRSRGILVYVSGVYQFDILGDGIAHGTDIAFKRDTAVTAARSRTCGNAEYGFRGKATQHR